ncbi:hypothetical protein JTE90_001234 [Oedothorax gibbosus]|uniref:Uncharacterized protein n=1 Tax=Oedothorax gibbosus TaxID=931172 RepID=A0AAV6UX23_9ARAC|nr:hypothetical protein JTE90_001234 [Oedothorax gibbosus]
MVRCEINFHLHKIRQKPLNTTYSLRRNIQQIRFLLFEKKRFQSVTPKVNIIPNQLQNQAFPKSKGTSHFHIHLPDIIPNNRGPDRQTNGIYKKKRNKKPPYAAEAAKSELIELLAHGGRVVVSLP